MYDSERISRRSVLKATGTAAAVAVGGAGTAAAFSVGDCVVTVRSADAWIEACPPDGKTRDVPEGTTGTVQDTCFHDGTEYLQVEWNDYPLTWVSEDDVDGC